MKTRYCEKKSISIKPRYYHRLGQYLSYGQKLFSEYFDWRHQIGIWERSMGISYKNYRPASLQS